MSVPFQQAIQELQSIFGDFDKDIIETVLRQNKGHMEKTIDTLLEMNGEKPINENPEADHNVAQIEQDEDLARMLQNELFINQLRNDQDFSSLFNNNTSSGTNRSDQIQNQNLEAIRQERIRRDREGFYEFQQKKLQQQQQQQQYRQHSYSDDDVEEEDEIDDGPSALSLIEEDFQDLKEKFNQLGEAAKTKFKELTNMFLNKEEAKYEPVKTSSSTTTSSTATKEQSDEDDEEVIVYDKYNKTTHHRNVNNSNNNNNNNSNSNHDSIFSTNNSFTTQRNRNYTSTINDSNNYSINNSESEDEFDSFILESDRNRNVNRLRTINSYNDNHKKQD